MGRRRGSRYLNILRGSDQEARTRLLGYLQGTNRATYPERQVARPAPVRVFLDPFGLPLAADVKLEDTMYGNFAAVGSFVTGFTSNTPPAQAANAVKLDRAIAPRVSITTGRTAAGTSRVSQITGRSYKDYGGDTIVVPFGKGSGTDQDTPGEVFRIIRGRVKAASAANLCSLIPGVEGL